MPKTSQLRSGVQGQALAWRRPNVRPDFPPLHPGRARHVFGLDVFGSGLA